MHLAKVLAAVPPELANHRRVAQARFLHGITGFAQLALAAALFVTWHYYHVPFWTAAERCFAAGVCAWVAIGAVAGTLLTRAGVQPRGVILRYLGNIFAIGVFAALHYGEGMSFAKSFFTWAVVWIAARLLVGRIDRRARGALVPSR